MYIAIIVLIINFLYFVVELIGGFYFNSTTLKADAFHMLADILAITISIYCEYLSTLKKTDRTTFGWKRSNILGGFTNTIFLLSACLFIFIESVTKFFEPVDMNLEDNIDLFIIIAAIGLIINLVSMLLYSRLGFAHSHGEENNHEHNNEQKYSMNTKALLLHFMSDTLGSIIVIIAGVLIKFDNNSKLTVLYDPICSIILICIIAIPAIKLYKKSFRILLQYSPPKIENDKLKMEILDLQFVIGIHELHIWQLDENIIIGSIHYHSNNNNYLENQCVQIKNIFHKYGIHSSTIQPEFTEICNEPTCDPKCDSRKCCIIEAIYV